MKKVRIDTWKRYGKDLSKSLKELGIIHSKKMTAGEMFSFELNREDFNLYVLCKSEKHLLCRGLKRKYARTDVVPWKNDTVYLFLPRNISDIARIKTEYEVVL